VIFLLSLCGFFEIYEIALTSLLGSGLIRTGVFDPSTKGLFGLNDQASFVAATFFGFFVGTSSFAVIADRLGRRPTLLGSLAWYIAASVIMAAQHTAISVDVWRFIAGIGGGVQLVTIDSYIAEMVPKRIRGKAFAINYGLIYIAVPVAGLLSWLLMPRNPLGISGWRYVAGFPLLAVVVIWLVHRKLPESPRWLLQRGRVGDAERVISQLVVGAGEESDQAYAPAPVSSEPQGASVSTAEIFRAPYLQRTLMLVTLNIFQAMGYYGYSNWVPALLESQGVGFVKSLQYTFIITLVYPLTPLFFALIADRFERKWQIVAGALGTAVFGLVFAHQSQPQILILLGALVTISNIVLSFSYHTYQSELYPTRVRTRAIGFVYSFGRLATIISGFAIAVTLRSFGTIGVFIFISTCMAVVVIAVGAFGPPTKGLALERTSH
jgi:putative MFS transporter